MNSNSIQLSDHFTTGKLIRFTVSPILMMIFTSSYGIVDELFVSNYAGADCFAALNLSVPFLMLLSSIGFMFGTGGVAFVSMTLGQGEKEKANRYFSLIVYTVIALGVCFSALGFVNAPFFARLLGADETLLPHATLYLRINLVGLTFFMLQNLFQSFLISAERPAYGFYIILIAGCTNMLLDWIFVGVLGMGLKGAAWATVAGQIAGGFIPFLYFFIPTTKLLHLGKTKFNGGVLLKVCANGSSEMVSSVAMSFVGILYNHQLIRYIGNSGVAAYGVLMYLGFIVAAIFIGYSMGVSPVISFNYGSGNKAELHNLFKKSIFIVGISSVVLTVLLELLAPWLVKIFVGYDEELYRLSLKAMHIYTFVFLFMGTVHFSSAFFTALNNGKVSAFISFFRVLVLETALIFVLPLLFGADGLWFVTMGSDGIMVIICAILVAKYRGKYGY